MLESVSDCVGNEKNEKKTSRKFRLKTGRRQVNKEIADNNTVQEGGSGGSRIGGGKGADIVSKRRKKVHEVLQEKEVSFSVESKHLNVFKNLKSVLNFSISDKIWLQALLDEVDWRLVSNSSYRNKLGLCGWERCVCSFF